MRTSFWAGFPLPPTVLEFAKSSLSPLVAAAASVSPLVLAFRLRDLGISGGGRVGGGRRCAGGRGKADCAAKARSLRLTADAACGRKRDDIFGRDKSSNRVSSGFSGSTGADVVGMTGLRALGNSQGFGEVGRGGGNRRGLGFPETCPGVEGRRNGSGGGGVGGGGGGGGGATLDEEIGNAFEIGNDKGGTGDTGGVVDKTGIGEGDKTGARANDGLGGNGGGVPFDGDESVKDEGPVGVRRDKGRRITELD